MDPNYNLRMIKHFLKRADGAELLKDRNDYDYCMSKVGNYTRAMIDWIDNGGFLPDDWKSEPADSK